MLGTQLYAQQDSAHYPIHDRRGDALSWQSRNPFDLRDTAILHQKIEYDPKTKQYYLVERIGSHYYRKPTFFTADEFYKLRALQSERDYFNERSQALSYLNRKVLRPKVQVYNSLFDRIFGIGKNGLKVDIKPQGSVDLTMGYQGQNIKNPTLPERARKNGGFDFDMNANLSVLGNIGDKLKLPINYNTLANFDYENQLKLDYKGKEDEILKSLEAGNISFQSKGTLIPGAQSLFGLKTQLQFGKLFVTAALANQRSQKQSIALQGGGVAQNILKKLDDYEENRHFLGAQYFRKNYNKTMSNLPVVSTQVQIQRMEVWITNRTGATTETRDIVGLMDLAEPAPYRQPLIQPTAKNDLPENGANDLYRFLLSDPNNRQPALINSRLVAKGLKPVEDFEKTFARKLNQTEYYFNPQAGFISLNQQLQPDEVLAVAYQYTYNGKVYQVGEFSQDVTVDSTKGVQKVLFLKLLKATSARTQLPIWKLMMKNVYSLDVFKLDPQEFKMNILYQDPSGGTKRYLPESDKAVEGRPIISILNADRLNNRNDPQPDGIYDYVEGFTVLSTQGKIIFPVLEPFGRDLDSLAFRNTPAAIKSKYIYNQLYDSIKAIAQTYANLNRFVAQGSVKGSSSSEIYLGAFNIPQGSVTVMAGGQLLQENIDYSIDYNLGTVHILNQAIINAGLPLNVQFENNAGFGIQQRSFVGLRLDYNVYNTAYKALALGASMIRLSERPFFTKMSYEEGDPIRNTMYGLDFSYNAQWPGLTRVLNRLPFYQTKQLSTINAYGEGAYLKPGHPPQIGAGAQGLIYVDDFEGTRSSIDLRFPFVSWALASTPAGNGLFPEATLNDSLDYGKNRAKLAWYNIEPVLQDITNPNNPLRNNRNALSDFRVRRVFTNELFPQRTTNITDVQTATFDLSYYPREKGPYNFTTDVDATGKLKTPKNRWGGIMRSIDQTDFETGNVEFIEFWIPDPFMNMPASSGGKLILNLGNVSEDVLKDGKRFYENGLRTPKVPAAIDSSKWGRVPVNPIQVTQAFSNDPDDRPFQDVGFDGLNDDDERLFRKQYLNDLLTLFGSGSIAYQTALKDPSSDDYLWYRDAVYDASGADILTRYKNFNNPQGNSPVATTNSQFSPAATLYPDNEDLNRDNTLNETEEYYEYQVDLKPGMDAGITKYITDSKVVRPKYANGTTGSEKWYLFRVPIKDYTSKVGNIPDFKSIRFIRMYLTGFDDSVVLRFAKLDLVRNQWRNFNYQLDTTGSYLPLANNTTTSLNTLAVNLEENSSRQPIPYKIPPGIERVQLLSNNGVNLLQNEQAMSLRVLNLQKNDSRAVFKTMNLDMRRYGRLSMFIHAEAVQPQSLNNGDLTAVIRIGQDFLNNYYEVRIPLNVTKASITATAEEIWPAENNLDFDLQDLVELKLRRNTKAFSNSKIYREKIGNKTFSLLGNPNLGEVRAFLIGVENSSASTRSAEVWVNELRLSQLNESGGYAALGRVDVQLADLGRISVSANTYTKGFGSIEQRVNERAKDNLVQFDAAATIDAGKLLPKKAGAIVPVYASINKTIRTPEFDPYDVDVLYKNKLGATKNRDSLKSAAVDQTTIKTLNLTGVRFDTRNPKIHLWSISNFDFNYSFTHIQQSTPLITKNDIVKYRGGFGYTYTGKPKYLVPFKKMIRQNTAWLLWLKDMNVNLTPSLLSFRADVNRQLGQYVPRIVNSYDGGKIQRVDTTFDKYFTFDRYYNFRWDLTHAVNIDFSAINNARIDEPYGLIDTKQKKDTVRRNFWKGGRNTLYTQKAVMSYSLPLNKFPLTDWITARYTLNVNYNWIGASRLAVDLGNIIENGQDNAIIGEFDFNRLYSKSRWLRSLDNVSQKGAPVSPPPSFSYPSQEEALKGLTGKERADALKKWRLQRSQAKKAEQAYKKNQPVEMGGLARFGGKLLTMVKRITVNLSENFRSRVPGYTDSTRFLGQNWNTLQPGLDYVFGKQPDTAWLTKKARQGVITRDTLFNLLFRQSLEQRFSIAAQLEPLRELMIDVNLEKTFTKDYSELFKDTIGNGSFNHLGPLAAGGFSVSYISFNTLFRKFTPNQVSETFTEFENNRIAISRRLANQNPYWKGLPAGQQFSQDGFARGYGRYAQDVLIPAFIAAYTGKSTDNVSLIKQSNSNIKSNPFSGIKPLPNWGLTYTGLTKIPAVAKIFSSITLTHRYSASLSMNNFSSALLFTDPFHYGAPSFLDTVSGNYIPFFLVPNLSMQEQFAPLAGIDITTNNQMNLKFEYRKTRQLSLSLIDFQLSEVRSTEWTFGASWRKKGFNLPFQLPFMKSKKLDNDVNFRIDLGMRDDAQTNSRLDQANAYSTGGQKVITIQPSIDYILNNRINLKFFFDQRRVIPYISTSAPITTTRAGLQLRVSLAQ
ncbi:MAG: sprA [Chitinophagaceae bacterium]|nr:sprA [Chitinophagaceae bacterium]